MNRRKGPDHRAEATVNNILKGEVFEHAGVNAGYSKSYMRGPIYNHTTAQWIKDEVVRRQKMAQERADVHTDTIVGNLVQIMDSSIADVMPDHPLVRAAREKGVDHLIKKMTITPIKCGVKTKTLKDGTVTETPVTKEKIEIEMYDRLGAISQLRDNFGMKQEPRANTFEETRRQEVERELESIMVSDKCDKPTAARKLLVAIGDAPQLVPLINKYIN